MTTSRIADGFAAAAGESGEALSRRSLAKRIRRFPETPLAVYSIFLAFVVGRYIQINARAGLLEAIRLEFLLGASSCGLAVAYISGRSRPIAGARGLIAAIALLFIVALTQLPFAADPVTARMIFGDRVFKFAMLTFLIAAFVESPRYLRWFVTAWLFAIFYITLEAFRGLLDGGLYWQNQGVMRLHGAVPNYAHPNSLGGVALGTIPFIWYFWNQFRRWFARAALLACATTSLVCVIYSGSRTAYVGLLGLVFWFWLQSERKFRFAMYVLVLGLGVVMLLPDQYIERFKSIGGKEKEGQSKETRIEILHDAWTILLENPLGVGVASFPAKRIERFGRKQDTHNLYLEVATNLGIHGLAVFLALVYLMMRMYGKVIRTSKRLRFQLRRACREPGLARSALQTAKVIDADLALLIATAQAAGGFIFARMLLGLFGMDLYEIYWWFGAGLAIALSAMLADARRSIGRWQSVIAGEGK